MTDTSNRPPLSPAAQAVYDAATTAAIRYNADRLVTIAAALRAAADQFLIRPDVDRSEYSILMRALDAQFRAIAAELEDHHG